MKNDTLHPSGDMLLQTLAMPADTNPSGDIFGGWIMAQMDMAGGILAKEVSQSRIVTVAVDSIQFIKPVHVGDVVCCYGEVVRVGTTSLTIHLEVWVKQVLHPTNGEDRQFKVTQAAFTYVAVDEDGKKRPIQRSRCPLP
jgi:acyl-CoA thioesterase YciA